MTCSSMTHAIEEPPQYASDAQRERHDPKYHPADPFEEWVYAQLQEEEKQ